MQLSVDIFWCFITGLTFLASALDSIVMQKGHIWLDKTIVCNIFELAMKVVVIVDKFKIEIA